MKKQKPIIIISSLCLLLCLCVGYAAFNTQLSIKTKGNVKRYQIEDYVQDYLFLHLDGINNEINEHNSNAKTWTNLVDNEYDLNMLGFNNLNWTDDNGLYFDGIDDSIDTGFNQETLGDNITIDAVVNTEETSNYRGLIGYHGESVGDIIYYKGLAIQFINNKLSWFYYNTAAKGSCFVELSEEQTANLKGKKVEITTVMSGNNFVGIYINGKEASKVNCAVSFDPWEEDNLIIAKSFKFSEDRYFKGTIYNYKIYNKALTDREIEQNYKVNKQRYELK